MHKLVHTEELLGTRLAARRIKEKQQSHEKLAKITHQNLKKKLTKSVNE